MCGQREGRGNPGADWEGEQACLGGGEAWTEAEEGAGRLADCWREGQQVSAPQRTLEALEAVTRGEATWGPAWSLWSAGNTDPKPKQLLAFSKKTHFLFILVFLFFLSIKIPKTLK